MRGLVSIFVLFPIFGCAAEVEPLEPGCVVPRVSTRLAAENTDKLDVLFMIDNSGGLSSARSVFSQSLADFFTRLSATRSASGAPDIHVGFVTSDLGAGGHPVPTCDSYLGDDGVLVRSGVGPDCGDVIQPGAPPFLSLRSTTDVDEFASDASCLAYIGDRGCGVEQQLEAVLKALTPSSSPLRFAMDTAGHGTAENAGFLRDDSVLAVILLTEEDDCAIRDPELFDINSEVYTETNLNLRCFRYGEPSIGAVHPIERYVDGLLALRSPERLVFAAVAGVPEDLASNAEDTPWEALVGDESVRDPRMTFTLEPRTNQPAACGRAGRSVAHAAVRITSVARDLEQMGARTGVHSICAETHGPAMTLIADQILEAMTGACVDMTLDVGAEAAALCDVVEVPRDGVCDGRHGRVPFGTSPEGPLCKLCRGDAEGRVIDDDPACQALGQAGWSTREASMCPTERPHHIEFAPLVPTSPRLLCPAPAACN